MKNTNENNPAFPCMPIQDQFNRLIAPIPGMSKLEYFTLNIYANNIKDVLPGTAIRFAKEIIQLLDESQKSDDNNNLQIIK
jgi:hypothetical protein